MRAVPASSMIIYGAGLADGNRHTHHDLPVMMVGKGGGTVKPGRRVVYRRETPITNMYLSMMDRMGVEMEQFADSTGHLNGLDLA